MLLGGKTVRNKENDYHKSPDKRVSLHAGEVSDWEAKGASEVLPSVSLLAWVVMVYDNFLCVQLSLLIFEKTKG